MRTLLTGATGLTGTLFLNKLANFIPDTEGSIEPVVAKAIIEWVEGVKLVAEVDLLSAYEI